MKIAICGSISCADKLIEVHQKLLDLGHETELPYYARKIKNGEISLKEFNEKKEEDGGDHNFRAKASEDLIMRYWRLIGESDAILIVNVDKKGIKNYIGGNSFLEMGFSYVLNKPIYLLNPIPDIGYNDEIVAMKPIVLSGDLEKINAKRA